MTTDQGVPTSLLNATKAEEDENAKIFMRVDLHQLNILVITKSRYVNSTLSNYNEPSHLHKFLKKFEKSILGKIRRGFTIASQTLVPPTTIPQNTQMFSSHAKKCPFSGSSMSTFALLCL